MTTIKKSHQKSLKWVAKLALTLSFAGALWIDVPVNAAQPVHSTSSSQLTNTQQVSPTINKLFRFYPDYPVVNYGTGKQSDLIKKGEYLVKMGDCIACHTDSSPNGAHIPFAGGLKFDTPFGAFYSPNITPDKQTGIGTWTEDDFIQSMQHGIRKDGSYNFPVYPFLYFTKVNKDDIRAIYAYMKQIPPVEKANREPGAPFPFSWRPSLLGWRILFFKSHEGEYQYDTKQTKEWNRGAYLVNGLGHCGMCHTPLNLLGAPKWKYFLTGAFIDNYWAPNISKSGLSSSTVDEAVSVFKQDMLVNVAGQVVGPMAEVNHNSLNKLTPQDLRAIVAYLKTVESKEPLGAHPIGKMEEINRINRGRQVYQKACVICHQNGVLGAPVIGDKNNWEQRALKGKPQLYINAINGYNQMPYKGGCTTCSNADIEAGVDYLLHVSTSTGVKTNDNKPNTTPALMAKPTVKTGQEIYKQSCALCHDNGAGGSPKLSDAKAWARVTQQNFDVIIGNVIHGKGNMPPNGGCETCKNADLISATKYMLEKSSTKQKQKNYSLW